MDFSRSNAPNGYNFGRVYYYSNTLRTVRLLSNFKCGDTCYVTVMGSLLDNCISTMSYKREMKLQPEVIWINPLKKMEIYDGAHANCVYRILVGCKYVWQEKQSSTAILRANGAMCLSVSLSTMRACQFSVYLSTPIGCSPGAVR